MFILKIMVYNFELKRAKKFFLIAVVITLIAFIITCIINPDFKVIMDRIENSHQPIKNSIGINKVWSYIVHNGITVPMQMVILTLIPIQYMYLLNMILTNLILGVVFGIAVQVDLEVGFQLIISSISHSVFEIFAYCILATVLFEMNQAIRVNIINIFKKDKAQVSLVKSFLKTMKAYIVFVMPLIIVAAFLETYLADTLLYLL